MHPQPESYFGNVNPIGERSCYDEGKRVAETLTFDYQREHGLEVQCGLLSQSLVSAKYDALLIHPSHCVSPLGRPHLSPAGVAQGLL